MASAEDPVVLTPNVRHRVYVSPGSNTADAYLTDINPELLGRERSLAEVSGSILHVHMFVQPRPGRTPIEPSAMSAAFRLVVAAEGEVGVYAGAGFLLPDNAPAGNRFGGTVRGGTLRLTAATPGFVDRLGAAELDLSFTARRNPETAGVIAEAMEDFVWRATSFAQTDPDEQDPLEVDADEQGAGGSASPAESVAPGASGS